MTNKEILTIKIKKPSNIDDLIDSLIDVIFEYKNTYYQDKYDDTSLKKLIKGKLEWIN